MDPTPGTGDRGTTRTGAAVCLTDTVIFTVLVSGRTTTIARTGGRRSLRTEAVTTSETPRVMTDGDLLPVLTSLGRETRGALSTAHGGRGVLREAGPSSRETTPNP